MLKKIDKNVTFCFTEKNFNTYSISDFKVYLIFYYCDMVKWWKKIYNY